MMSSYRNVSQPWRSQRLDAKLETTIEKIKKDCGIFAPKKRRKFVRSLFRSSSFFVAVSSFLLVLEQLVFLDSRIQELRTISLARIREEHATCKLTFPLT